tara:strand:- start:329 stop:817 length:489 start_codon:yes stop_codon:yes gene_type:complete
MKRSHSPKARDKTATLNRQAFHNYQIFEAFEAGMVLLGTEVKSIRASRVNLNDAYGMVKGGEVWLRNCHISPYRQGNRMNHEPLRTRKLLLHRREIRKLIGKTTQRGMTLIPLRIYFQNGRIKCEIALAKGKRLFDKREKERQKTLDRETRQVMKQQGLVNE